MKTGKFLVENKLSETQMSKHFGHLSIDAQKGLFCEYPLVQDSHGSRTPQKTFEVWSGEGDSAIPTGKMLRLLANGEWRVENSLIYG